MKAMRLLLALLALLAAGAAAPARAADEPVRRTILAIVDSEVEGEVRFTRIHRRVEMPLNHLGLTVEYWDIRKGLPDIADRPDVRGILTWFEFEGMPEPRPYLEWASKLIDKGMKFVVIGQLGARYDLKGKGTPMPLINRFLTRLGVKSGDTFVNLTYNVTLPLKDSQMMEFERPIRGELSGYYEYSALDPRLKPYLTARRNKDPGTDSLLVFTSPNGGVIQQGYGAYADERTGQTQWLINPFLFFRTAFATDDLPKPDTTTLNGRRLFYSHIDGDGWRNLTEVPAYQQHPATTAEVILNDVLKKFPDLPVTVAPIVGDIDPAWYGSAAQERLVREMFALPNVTPASHTTSHPYDWEFFANYRPEKESRWTEKGGLRFVRRLFQSSSASPSDGGKSDPELARYEQPRAYLLRPFDLDTEIGGSIAFLQKLAPPGKKVGLIQWPGDTKPYEGAIAATRTAGVRNINGGDSRFDEEYPSLTNVAPVGIRVGAQRQIYSSNSNENTYTDLWTDRFFGFRFLVRTVRRTDSPIRLKPFNIYYHFYSGEKLSSLNAVLSNMREAQAAKLAPVTAEQYAGIGDGFFTTRLTKVGDRQWRVEDRDGLDTIRFDQSTFTGVDFARSKGVIGQRHYQGSLYVALNPSERAPVIALKDLGRADEEPGESASYLVQSRWRVADLQRVRDSVRFSANGYGQGEMEWRMQQAGAYDVAARRAGATLWRSRIAAGSDGILRFSVAADGIEPLDMEITPVEGRT